MLKKKFTVRFIFLLTFALISICALASCTKKTGKFKPKPMVYELGNIEDFIFTKVYEPTHKMIVFRDKSGWSAMNARCTSDACDLSYYGKGFYCPCCNSDFDLNGIPLQSKSKAPLYWHEMLFKDGKLYANTEKIVKSDYRFMTPQLSALLERLKVPLREETIRDTKTPRVLSQQPEYMQGKMFVETDPNQIAESQMIK